MDSNGIGVDVTGGWNTVTIQNLNISTASALGMGIDSDLNTDLTIDNVDVSGRQEGMRLANGVDTLVTNNNFSDATVYGLWLNVHESATLTDNTFDGAANGIRIDNTPVTVGSTNTFVNVAEVGGQYVIKVIGANVTIDGIVAASATGLGYVLLSHNLHPGLRGCGNRRV